MKKTTTISSKTTRFGILAAIICVTAILCSFFALTVFIASDICKGALESGISYARNILENYNAYSVISDDVTDDAAYDEILTELKNIRFSNVSINHLMVFVPHNEYLIYLFDTDIDGEHSDYGDIYEYDDFYNGVKARLNKNESVPHYLSVRSEGGLTLAAFEPAADSSGNIYGYIEMDISISGILSKLAGTLILALAAVIVFTTLAIAALALFIKRNITDNILKICRYTNEYFRSFSFDENQIKPEIPCIKTNDEIEQLFRSIRTMTENVDEYADRQKVIMWSAEHDKLTTLENRNKLFDRIEKQYIHMNSLFFVAASINNLKEMNEKYSFKSGDSVLIKVAKEMRTIMSENIHAYRVGGDEFVIVMCNFEKDSAESYINDWSKDIGRLNRADDTVNCTLAIGYAYSDNRPLDINKLFEEACRKMLENKELKNKL